MKYLFSTLFLVSIVVGCGKSDSSPTDNNGNDNSIQKKIENTKWYYDSIVYLVRSAPLPNGKFEFKTYLPTDIGTYIYFGEDSIMTEFDWNGSTYDKTEYPYVFQGEKLYCPGGTRDYPILANNELIIGDVNTLPSETDTTKYGTNEVELIWDYYHK